METTNYIEQARRIDTLITLLDLGTQPSLLTMLSFTDTDTQAVDFIDRLQAASHRFDCQLEEYILLAVESALTLPQRFDLLSLASPYIIASVRFKDFQQMYAIDSDRPKIPTLEGMLLISLYRWLEVYGEGMAAIEMDERYSFLIATRSLLHPVWVYDSLQARRFWSATGNTVMHMAFGEAAKLHALALSKLPVIAPLASVKKWCKLVDSEYGDILNGTTRNDPGQFIWA